MPPDPLDALLPELRETDRALLRALAERARLPRDPAPEWIPPDPRLPPPPLAEILYTLFLESPPPESDTDGHAVETANRALAAALAARQRLAARIADETERRLFGDVRAAVETADGERLRGLLADLPGDLRTLDFIGNTAGETNPGLPPDAARFLWREYLLPWSLDSQAAQLTEP